MAQMMTQDVTPLAAYLRTAAARRFCWGAWAERSHDCCTFAWDWVRERTGIDAMADLRGRYRSAEDALDLLRENGCATLADAMRIGAARVGLSQTDDPQPGDVGLVEIDRGLLGDAFLCIRMDHAWAAPGLRGIAETRAPALICWRVP